MPANGRWDLIRRLKVIVPSYDFSRVITLRRNGRSRVATRVAYMRQISRAYTT